MYSLSSLGVQPLSETVPNLAIDLGVIGAAFFLYSQDVKAGERRLQRLQRQDMVGSLPIEISNGKVIKVADLKSSRRVLLVTGDALSVKTVLDAGVKVRIEIHQRKKALSSRKDDQSFLSSIVTTVVLPFYAIRIWTSYENWNWSSYQSHSIPARASKILQGSGRDKVLRGQFSWINGDYGLKKKPKRPRHHR